MALFFPGNCWECHNPIVKVGDSVLLYCGCLILVCQDCARQQISSRKKVFDSFLICPLCNLTSDLSTLILDVRKAQDQVTNLLKSCFGFFKIKFPSFKKPQARSFQQVISKLSSIGSKFDENLYSEKDGKVVALKVAQLELQRLKKSKHDKGFVDPLSVVSFKSNVLFEKVILGVRGDCSYTVQCNCIVCEEPIEKGRSILLTCNCSNTVLCSSCVYQILANQEKTYYDGIKCPTCKKTSQVLGGVKEAKELELSLVSNAFKHFQYKGIKTKMGEVQELHDLYALYATNGMLGTIDPKTYFQDEADHVAKQTTTQFLRLEIARLELMRQNNVKSSDAMNPHKYLGPLSKLCFMQHKFLDIFLKQSESKPEMKWLDEPDSILMFDEHHKQVSDEVREINQELIYATLSAYETRDLTRPEAPDSPPCGLEDLEETNIQGESRSTSEAEEDEEYSSESDVESEVSSVPSLHGNQFQNYASSSSVPSNLVASGRAVLPASIRAASRPSQAPSSPPPFQEVQPLRRNIVVSDDDSDDIRPPSCPAANTAVAATPGAHSTTLSNTHSTPQTPVHTTQPNEGFALQWQERDPTTLPPTLALFHAYQTTRGQPVEQRSLQSQSSIEEMVQAHSIVGALSSVQSATGGLNVKYFDEQSDHQSNRDSYHKSRESRVDSRSYSTRYTHSRQRSRSNSFRSSRSRSPIHHSRASKRSRYSREYERKFAIGEKVTVYVSTVGKYFSAVIDSFGYNNTYDVSYDNGRRLYDVDENMLRHRGSQDLNTYERATGYVDNRRSPKFEEGFRVEVSNNGVWYAGRVKKVRDNGQYDIAYQDGTTESNVDERFIRLCPTSSFYSDNKPLPSHYNYHYDASQLKNLTPNFNSKLHSDSRAQDTSHKDSTMREQQRDKPKKVPIEDMTNQEKIPVTLSLKQSEQPLPGPHPALHPTSTSRYEPLTSAVKVAKTPNILKESNEKDFNTKIPIVQPQRQISDETKTSLPPAKRVSTSHILDSEQYKANSKETEVDYNMKMSMVQPTTRREKNGMKEHILTMGMFYSSPSTSTPNKLESFVPATLKEVHDDNDLRNLCKKLDFNRMSNFVMILQTPPAATRVPANRFIEENIKGKSYRFHVKLYFDEDIIQRYERDYGHLIHSESNYKKYFAGELTSYSPQSTLGMLKNIARLQIGLDGNKIKQFLGSSGQILEPKSTLAEYNILTDTTIIIRPVHHRY